MMVDTIYNEESSPEDMVYRMPIYAICGGSGIPQKTGLYAYAYISRHTYSRQIRIFDPEHKFNYKTLQRNNSDFYFYATGIFSNSKLRFI